MVVILKYFFSFMATASFKPEFTTMRKRHNQYIPIMEGGAYASAKELRMPQG